MRKKLQDKMFEASYLFEILISIIIGIAIIAFGVSHLKAMNCFLRCPILPRTA